MPLNPKGYYRMPVARHLPSNSPEIKLSAKSFQLVLLHDPDILKRMAKKYRVEIKSEIQNDEHEYIILTIQGKVDDISKTKENIKMVKKELDKNSITRILKKLRPDSVKTLTEVAWSFKIVANDMPKHTDQIVMYGFASDVDKFIFENKLKGSEKFTIYGAWHDIKKKFDSNVAQSNTVIGNNVVHKEKIGQIQVKLEVIDITNLGVDCIVNSTNEALKHRGGVAGAIAKQAGRELLTWSQDWVQRHGNVPRMEVVISPGFNLPCRHVLHVVSPNRGDANYTHILCETMKAILLTVQQKKWSSVALPPIGSGRGGIPIQEVADVIVHSIRAFSQEKSKLIEITITDITDDVLQVIAHTFKKISNIPVYSQRKKADQQSHNTPPPRPETTWMEAAMSRSDGQVHVGFHSQPWYDAQRMNQTIGPSVRWQSNFNSQTGDQNGVMHSNQMENSSNPCVFVARDRINERLASGEALPYRQVIDAGAASVYVTDNPRHQVTGASNIDASSTADSGTLNRNYQYLDSIGGVKNNAFNMIDSINKSFDSSNPSDICRSVRRKYPDEQNEKDGASNQQYLQSIGGLSSDNAPYVIDSINRSVDSANQAGTCTSVRRKYPDKQNEKDDICVICCDEITDKKTLPKCKHSFCQDCIEQAFVFKPACPTCNTLYGTVTGNQPEDGQMDDYKERESLPGYEGCETIVIVYSFPDGTQGSEHPSPGRHYRGIRRTCYLPDNDEGNQVLTLLKTAFDARLTFTIGRSTTTGKEGVITWNDIHHKTKKTGGPERYGYPDSEYLTRVKDELAAKGIE